MKVGIDSYCYHRYFGEVYPGQPDPPGKMSMADFIDRAHDLGVDGIAVESCFLPRFDQEYLSEIKGRLDQHGMDRVYAWGHPDGLEGGRNEKMFGEMMESFEYAKAIGAEVMRVVGSSLMFRFEPHGPQIERLSRMFSEAAKEGEKHGIKMAVENHLDFNSDEILTILQNVNSPFLGVNFDSGNFVRVLDDPVQAMEKLVKHVYATHIKDLKIQKGVPVNEWYFFSCTPVGDAGLVDNMKLAQLLEDNGYEGLFAVEIDFLHPDYMDKGEDQAVEQSIRELTRIARAVEKQGGQGH
jgi:sugar phosphate isomerase/epimerase